VEYVLITPARNEATFIEETLKSVAAQTVRPLKWVIVSDGSTDGTDELVQRYASRHDWIQLIRTADRDRRHFAAKVHAFNAGYEAVRNLSYDAIGSLDADISFTPDYFEFLLSRLQKNSALGLVGTPFREGNKIYDYRFVSIEHVSGACQLFRRECFESIGGYTPSEIGGVDLIAVINARMKGWQTRTFPEKLCSHHRKVGGAKHGQLMTAFRGGRGDYVLGGHPVWELCRSAYQMTRWPWFFAGFLRFIGYLIAMIARAEKVVPPEFVVFRRQEQMRRLRCFFTVGYRTRQV
jgi:biofilm PGA synthesis N-glycosyltransferase PgaC